MFQNIEFLYGLFALVPLVGLLFFVLKWKQKARKLLGNERLVSKSIENYSERKYIAKVVIILIAIVLLIITAANPHKTIKSETTLSNGIDVIIALDVSKSMLAADEQPIRLDKAKEFINKLIQNLQDNRVGLVVFAGKAYLQMPLTNDMTALKMFLDNANPNLINYQGTNIGEALTLCSNSLDTKEKKYKAAILITDGEDQDTKALEAAKALADKGVIVHTIGVGEETGTEIIESGTSNFKRDANGNIVITKLNTSLLEQIASTTGGSYHHLDNAEAVSKDLSDTLNSMKKKGIENAWGYLEYQSYYFIFLGLAIVLLVLELFISERKSNIKFNKATLGSIVMLFFVIPSFSQSNAIKGANELYKKGDYKAAQSEYEKVLESETQNKVALFNYANCLYNQEQYATSVKQLNLLIENTSEFSIKAKAWYNKGLAEVRMQLYEQAKASFIKVLLLNNSDEDARENLQMVINELNKLKGKRTRQTYKDESTQDGQISKKQLQQQMEKLRSNEENLRRQIQERGFKQEGNNGKDW